MAHHPGDATHAWSRPPSRRDRSHRQRLDRLHRRRVDEGDDRLRFELGFVDRVEVEVGDATRQRRCVDGGDGEWAVERGLHGERGRGLLGGRTGVAIVVAQRGRDDHGQQGHGQLGGIVVLWCMLVLRISPDLS